MNYFPISKQFFIICYIFITYNIYPCQALALSRTGINNQTFLTDKFLVDIIKNDYDNAVTRLQQTPEILQHISQDTFTNICNLINIRSANQIESKYAIAARLLHHNPKLCNNFDLLTLKQMCDHVNDDLDKHADLFKALITSFRETKEKNFDNEFSSLVTTNQTTTDRTVYSLPKQLQEFLLEQQNEPQLDPNVWEVSPQYNSITLYQHPAIIRDNSTDRIHFNIHNNNRYHLPLLHHIVTYAYPEICLSLLKLAILKGASVRDVYLGTPVDDHARAYNPSCVFFLQQYQNLAPDERPLAISTHDLTVLKDAYNEFMIYNQPKSLYQLLKPHIAEKNVDQKTLQYRNCFTKSYKIYESSFHNSLNTKCLYTQLLPLLVKAQSEAENSVDAMDQVSIRFFDAILNNQPKIILDMCQRGYDPNTIYVGSSADYYGYSPLIFAIAQAKPEITKILLRFSTSLWMDQHWYPIRHTIAHFALHSCWHEYKRYAPDYYYSAQYPQALQTLRIILEHERNNINRPERETGKTLLETAIQLVAVTIPENAKDINIDIIRLLLELGADPFIRPATAISLESLAENFGNKTLAQWLINYKRSHPRRYWDPHRL